MSPAIKKAFFEYAYDMKKAGQSFNLSVSLPADLYDWVLQEMPVPLYSGDPKDLEDLKKGLKGTLYVYGVRVFLE